MNFMQNVYTLLAYSVLLINNKFIKRKIIRG